MIMSILNVRDGLTDMITLETDYIKCLKVNKKSCFIVLHDHSIYYILCNVEQTSMHYLTVCYRHSLCEVLRYLWYQTYHFAITWSCLEKGLHFVRNELLFVSILLNAVVFTGNIQSVWVLLSILACIFTFIVSIRRWVSYIFSSCYKFNNSFIFISFSIANCRIIIAMNRYSLVLVIYFEIHIRFYNLEEKWMEKTFSWQEYYSEIKQSKNTLATE